ncbi:Ni Fe-hydrogenase III large subunit-like protein [Gluconacetobacter aggeris]|uniref:Ni Fe-hydrogenase III large subunit-like protein n=1 Tax=Gluconacetobacter aggeris TaxID=1286186 RepID=A0A7W4NYF6_9PROT|nr:Ni Fe-hydrogenase III large subunit-like protein [Gluconacetobacter aggeris]MBB2167580.1 Ni Fe-hydrogenase III large subunit-like protein [Gluconacetobacter aggeris]
MIRAEPYPAPRTAAALIRRGEAEAGGWRFRLEEEGWHDLAEALRHDPLPFVTLWANGRDVHALFLEGGERPLVASVEPYGGRYLGLSPARPAAAPFERCVQDLWGFSAMEARDVRPWLDHGLWTATWPLSARPGPAAWPPDPPDFRPVPGECMILGSGPADGGHHAPAHLRLAVDGGGVVGQAEWRLGYAHRGVVARLAGLDADGAVRLAGRAVAGASVAHQSALCRAIEAATGQTADAATVRTRVLLAEIERAATHLHDLSRVARAAGGATLAAECERLREAILEQCGRIGGHRLLMDRVCPGGAGDPAMDDVAVAIGGRVADLLEAGRAALVRCRGWPGLEARIAGVGVLDQSAARALGVGGVVGRASAREEDLRRLVPGYRREWLDSGVRRGGDVAARIDLRLTELGGVARLLRAAAGSMPDAGWRQQAVGEGVGFAEGPRGAVWYWVRMVDGRVAAAHACDPALAQACALEHVLAGAQAEDVGMIVRSFGLSAAGADL